MCRGFKINGTLESIRSSRPKSWRRVASKDERIEKALRSFEIADRAGWGEVEAAMARYGPLPEGYPRDPAAFVARLPP